jgi:hypothetical protein
MARAREKGGRTTTPLLLGRDTERAAIGDLLAGARASRSAALVISGEPGVGKSALLDEAAAQAADMRVLSGAGVESEAHLPFAALHQLVRPVLEHLENLPEPQARALRGALGLAPEAGADRFLVSLAVLSLLAETAELGPVLCLVDDAHWLDDASADAFVFVARRLEAEGIVVLFAAREGEVRRFEAPGLARLELGGLDSVVAGELIDRHAGSRLSPELRDRLIAETDGNPLAMLELASALSDEQLSGADAVLAPMPVGDRVARAFLARVLGLPEGAQTLLLVAAADDAGELATVLRAAEHLEVPADALDDAEQGRARARTWFAARAPSPAPPLRHLSGRAGLKATGSPSSARERARERGRGRSSCLAPRRSERRARPVRRRGARRGGAAGSAAEWVRCRFARVRARRGSGRGCRGPRPATDRRS